MNIAEENLRIRFGLARGTLTRLSFICWTLYQRRLCSVPLYFVTIASLFPALLMTVLLFTVQVELDVGW